MFIFGYFFYSSNNISSHIGTYVKHACGRLTVTPWFVHSYEHFFFFFVLSNSIYLSLFDLSIFHLCGAHWARFVARVRRFLSRPLLIHPSQVKHRLNSGSSMDGAVTGTWMNIFDCGLKMIWCVIKNLLTITIMLLILIVLNNIMYVQVLAAL
jgi:hypothetical protein